MPITWTMDRDAGVVRVCYTEPFTFEEWAAMFADLRHDPTLMFQRQLGILVDRTAIGPLAGDFAMRVAAFAAAFPSLLKGRRIALVVRTEDLARPAWREAMLYEVESEASASVFLSIDEAEDWLRADTESTAQRK
jgi:hypothetical protein